MDQWSETYSDHNYIFYDIGGTRLWNYTRQKKKVWNLSKFDEDKFDTSILGATWSMEEEGINANEKVVRMIKIITDACDEAMPRKVLGKHPRQIYWWNDNIAEIRKKCIKEKRILTRIRKKASIDAEVQMVLENTRQHLKQKRKRLRVEINKAKNTERIEMIKTIENEPWGKPYKLVMDKLIGRRDSPLQFLTVENVQRVIDTLFSTGHSYTRSIIQNTEWHSSHAISQAEICRALKRASRGKKASGPDDISAGILICTFHLNPSMIINTFESYLKEGIFPTRWKKAKLVLIKKPHKEAREPSSYRPLCLLDEAAKLLERIIIYRLEGWIASNGGGYIEPSIRVPTS